jgi:YesN/AraC family two-component response regulator
MFLSKGFDGYISKPIDLRELNAVLNRLIRDKQPSEVVEAIRKEADKAVQGSEMVQYYINNDKIMKAVVRDINKSIAVLNSGADINMYTTTVHGLKSALNNIGEVELARVAYELEQYGKNNDSASIASGTPPFIDALHALVERIKPSA